MRFGLNNSIGVCWTFALAVFGAALPVSAAETPKPAAQQQPAQTAVPNEPTVTTAAFGDWVMRCQRLGDTPKPAKLCEIAETIQVQGQQAPFAQIAVGRLGPGKPLIMTAVLPTRIALPSAVTIEGGEKSQTLVWNKCVPGGCFAEATLAEEVAKAWRLASDNGKLTFKDASGQDVSFPISFRGFQQALDALAAQQ